MKTILKHGFIASIILAITLLTADTVEAGFFDRAKDIYNMPEKVEEIQQEYDAAKQQLENQMNEQREQFETQLSEQREQLEQSRQQAEQLLSRQDELQESNEYYRQQSELLAAENQNLLLKLEQAEQERKSFYHKLVLVIGAVIVLFLLYAFSVRIWRYVVWRKQKSGRSVLTP